MSYIEIYYHRNTYMGKKIVRESAGKMQSFNFGNFFELFWRNFLWRVLNLFIFLLFLPKNVDMHKRTFFCFSPSKLVRRFCTICTKIQVLCVSTKYKKNSPNKIFVIITRYIYYYYTNLFCSCGVTWILIWMILHSKLYCK